MPPKRATRNTRAKVPKEAVSLTDEQQQLRDQCDLLLKDFDKQCEGLKAEAAREAKTAGESITTIYRLEMMKIPMETKAMRWEDYYEQHGGRVLGVSQAVAEALQDSVVEAVDAQVNQIKTAIKNTTVKKARKKKLEVYGDENEPQTLTRTSSRRRVASKTLADFETPSTIKATSRTKSVLETPANSRAPMLPLQTPMITPKFDTMSLTRTISRVAKAGEVLVSLSGSPVAPAVGPRTKAGKEIASQNALIPLGDGNTLNMPLAEQEGGMDVTVEMTDEQMAKLELLHKQLGNMLRMRGQDRTVNASTMDI